MSDVVIRAEQIGKKYLISHKAERERYTALRDVIGRAAGKYARALRGGLKAHRSPPKDTLEEFWALKDVDFEIRRGDVVGIVGSNGAGKSTLLKVLTRITEPSQGRAEIKGRLASLLEVGTGFHPELTGKENIFLNGSVLGMTRSEIKAKFDEIVEFAGVERFLDTPVKRYSSGMYVRLAFAVASHLEPEILVIDEVLAVGDAEFQKRCLGKMKDVAGHGRTVLFVSHNMSAVEALCTRVLCLAGGRLEFETDDVRQGTTRYLQGTSGEGVSEWRNPGHAYRGLSVVPQRVWLGDAEGQVLGGAVSNADDIYFFMDLDLAEVDPALTIGFRLYTDDGTLLYTSYQSDPGEAQKPPLRAGRNIVRGRLPRRLLNEGAYRVELVGGLHFRQWLFEPGGNNPKIAFEIRGGLSDSPLWTARRPGLLAPVVDWERI